MSAGSLSIIACGASAAISLHSHLVALREQVDAELRVLLTHSAVRFVNPEAVARYADRLYTSDDPGLNPTEFAMTSRALVVLPASAHTMACAALGLAGSPAQTALLAWEGAALFLPSMNRTMWRSAVMRRNVAGLRALGHVVVDPVEGRAFELWRRETVPAEVMPPPERCATIIARLLTEGDRFGTLHQGRTSTRED